MIVKSAEFVTSAVKPFQYPEARHPEAAFAGRSNVGKSSLINTLLGRRNIARTSNTPGKTRTANYYRVNDEFCFVDMPGYGYARVSRTERAQWQQLIAGYLRGRAELRGAVQLLDIRHSPSREDKETAVMLREVGMRLCLAFNKSDKVKKASVDSRIASHVSSLSVDPQTAVVPFSSETGEGKRQLWAWIADSFAGE